MAWGQDGTICPYFIWRHRGRRAELLAYSQRTGGPLDVDRFLPAAVARITYSLPYCSGLADHVRAGDVITTRVQRRWPGSTETATTEIAVRSGALIDDSDPQVGFMTARWGLISATRRGRLRYAPVDHPTWELYEVDLVLLSTIISWPGGPAGAGRTATGDVVA